MRLEESNKGPVKGSQSYLMSGACSCFAWVLLRLSPARSALSCVPYLAAVRVQTCSLLSCSDSLKQLFLLCMELLDINAWSCRVRTAHNTCSRLAQTQHARLFCSQCVILHGKLLPEYTKTQTVKPNFSYFFLIRMSTVCFSNCRLCQCTLS